MKILLIAMPDTVSALDAVMKIPNLGICSLAGNLDGHTVKSVDLVFHNRNIRRYLEGILNDFQPDMIGLSAMSYQYNSACKASRICRSILPSVKIALGGYHASLMYHEIGEGPDQDNFDFLIRGEGEAIFQNLADATASGIRDYSGVQGLSYRNDGQFRHNPPAELLDLNLIKLPNRESRVLDRAEFLGQSFDCVETSRGCTAGCHFCSIGQMYGRTVRMFSLERVISDLKNLKDRGKQGIYSLLMITSP